MTSIATLLKRGLGRWLRRGIGWPVEAVLFYPLAALVWVLPVAVASAVGGAVFGTLGPISPWNRRVMFNIGYAMPEKSIAEKRQISKQAWQNLGRVMGEFFHIRQMLDKGYVDIEGAELLDPARGGFMVSAHLGCWEVGSSPAVIRKLPLGAVYRPINNPLIAPMLKGRLKEIDYVYEKGPQGARGMAETLKKKGFFCMVVDQKLREGMMLDFFGHKASTPIAHVKLALRMNVPIFMIHVVRGKGCRQRVTVIPLEHGIPPGRESDTPENVAAIATRINAIIEDWIRQNPGQWLWHHRRWPASKNEAPPQDG